MELFFVKSVTASPTIRWMLAKCLPGNKWWLLELERTSINESDVIEDVRHLTGECPATDSWPLRRRRLETCTSRGRTVPAQCFRGPQSLRWRRSAADRWRLLGGSAWQRSSVSRRVSSRVRTVVCQLHVASRLRAAAVNSAWPSLRGYAPVLRATGRHFRDFLTGIDNLHESMRFSYPRMVSPSFYVSTEDPTGCYLHYRYISQSVNQLIPWVITSLSVRPSACLWYV